MTKEKESGIEKLIELLNEYVEKQLFCYDDVTDHKGWTMQDEAMVICSKKFGFIIIIKNFNFIL